MANPELVKLVSDFLPDHSEDNLSQIIETFIEQDEEISDSTLRF